jgi:hypothetical protein
VWTEDSTDTRVIVCGRRAGTSAVERQVWDIERARRAGYLSNDKYKTDPQAMLWARAASVVCRRIAQDVLKGITASTEEIIDEDARSSPPPKARTVQRAALPAAAAPAEAGPAAGPRWAPTPAAARPGPPLPGEDIETPAAAARADAPDGGVQEADPVGSGGGEDTPARPGTAEPARLTEKQWRDINAWFVASALPRVNGSGQREARLYVISTLADRPIRNGSDLSTDEGVVILDTLHANGSDVVRKVLGIKPVPGRAPAAVPAVETAPGDAAPAADDEPTVEQVADIEDPPEHDPTTQPDWTGVGS